MAASPWLISGIILVGITALLASFYLYFNQPPRALNPTAAREAIRDRTFDVIIDVRSDAEWISGHDLRAIHIPLDQLPRKLPHEVSDRDMSILFYCQTGRRAATAAAIAADLGYWRTAYLAGGDYTELARQHTFQPN